MGSATYTIEQMRQWAAERGGLCLSTDYRNATTKLRWQCAKGHIWDATPKSLRQGSWCPICARQQQGDTVRLTLDEMRQLATARGGVCLSEQYTNNRVPLRWRCRFGHEWEAMPGNIKRGQWCPVCAIDASRHRAPGSIEEMRRMANERGGRCLSAVYVNSKTRLRWQCAAGHQWQATPNSVKSRGSWCPICGGTATLLLQEMRAIARQRGGLCLSTRYVNQRTPLQWQCAAGHQWEATPGDIKQKQSWCPICAKNSQAARFRLSLDDMQSLAARRGGQCLSDAYTNNKTKLRWQCAEGHQWEAIPKAISQGQWCPICARQKRKE